MQPIETYLHPTRKQKIYRMDYPSLGAFSRDCKEAQVARKYSHGSDPSWWGGDSMNTLLDKCVAGEETHIGAANALLDQLRDEIDIERPQWSLAEAGGFPDVAAFLAGEVECMRSLRSDPSVTAPVRVYFDPTSSASLSAQALMKRGAAALALAMALAQIRPVELWTFSDIEAKGDDLALICAKIQTTPLMLAEACYALCNPGYARALTYGLAEVRTGFTGGWGFGENYMGAAERSQMMREALRASPDDIVILGAHSEDELVSDPLAFIRRELARFHRVQEDA
jgi:hypothetical protein